MSAGPVLMPRKSVLVFCKYQIFLDVATWKKFGIAAEMLNHKTVKCVFLIHSVIFVHKWWKYNYLKNTNNIIAEPKLKYSNCLPCQMYILKKIVIQNARRVGFSVKKAITFLSSASAWQAKLGFVVAQYGHLHTGGFTLYVNADVDFLANE